MSLQAENQITLQETDGVRSNFDAIVLRQELIHCFQCAGLGENSFLAEDIALAIEYTFSHSGRRDMLFSRSELDAAVTQILKDTGMPDVARIYGRNTRRVINADCRPDSSTIRVLLGKFIGGSEERLNTLAGKVAEAAALLKIDHAPPGLLLELARYYETAVMPPPSVVAPPTPSGETRSGQTLLGSDELYKLLPDGMTGLFRISALKIQSISRTFPSIRFFCSLPNWAAHVLPPPPVTELLLEPRLFQFGRELDQIRRSINDIYRDRGGDAPLPVYLNFQGMGDFLEKHLGVENGKSRRLAGEVAAMTTAGLTCGVEKVTF